MKPKVSFLEFLAIAFSLIVILFIGSQFIMVLTAQKSTKYTPGFSYEKFLKIKKGTSRTEVIKTLGNPFPGNNKVPCDYYSAPKNNLYSWLNFGSWIGDAVCYDLNGNVSTLSEGRF